MGAGTGAGAGEGAATAPSPRTRKPLSSAMYLTSWMEPSTPMTLKETQRHINRWHHNTARLNPGHLLVSSGDGCSGLSLLRVFVVVLVDGDDRISGARGSSHDKAS